MLNSLATLYFSKAQCLGKEAQYDAPINGSEIKLHVVSIQQTNGSLHITYMDL